MDDSAWTTAHGRQHMDDSAWTTVHGRQCMDDSAWTTGHGRQCMDDSIWTTGHHRDDSVCSSILLLRQTLNNIVFRHNMIIAHFILAQNSSIMFGNKGT